MSPNTSELDKVYEAGKSKRRLSAELKSLNQTARAVLRRDAAKLLWDLTAKDPTSSRVVMHGHDGAVTALRILGNNHLLMTGSPDGTARLWDLTAKNSVTSPLAMIGPNNIGAVSPDDHWLVSGFHQAQGKETSFRIGSISAATVRRCQTSARFSESSC